MVEVHGCGADMPAMLQKRLEASDTMLQIQSSLQG